MSCEMNSFDNTNQRNTLEFDITYNCNIRCLQCNRGCGVCPSMDYMTINQVDKILYESLSLNTPYKNIWLLGGEPCLYKHLDNILTILNNYRKRINDCNIRLWTNGYGTEVLQQIVKLPSWMTITNSRKTPTSHPKDFHPFLVAAQDFSINRSLNFRSGCRFILPEKCGIGITRHGIYVCAIAGAIDRIIGYDIGLRKLAEISHERFQYQCEKICRFCGHFLFDNEIDVGNVLISRTWQKFIKIYKQQPPSLTLL